MEIRFQMHKVIAHEIRRFSQMLVVRDRPIVILLLALRLLALTLGTPSPTPAQQRGTTIEDCIGMVRLPRIPRVGLESSDPTIMFSDDGHRFIAMTLRGDLRTNLNIYSVLLFNA